MVSLQQMIPLAIAFVVVTLFITIGANVITETQDQVCGTWVNSSGGVSTDTSLNVYCTTGLDNRTGFSAENGLGALDTMGGWLPTIGLVVAAAVVIGVIIAYFRFG